MTELVTDMFTSALQRDVYLKVRDDVGGTLARVVDNFSDGRGTKGEVIVPATLAVAWVLRAILLVIKKQAGQAAYDEVLLAAITLISSGDSNDGRS